MGVLLQSEKNPLGTEVERSRLMNSVRTIIGSQETLKVLAKKLEVRA